ncbi:MAG: HAMP domain-containing histidine kinase [Cyclobacteriaceae bacterium]|nr:HAMP domain-containing histidine kinase [Cyclobacteriaceae bacterium]
MKRNTFRFVIILATFSIVGISIIQVYWFRRAFDLEDQRFNREVVSALHNVAGQFFELNKAAVPATNPIKQLSSNYFVGMVNNEIDANLLEFLLRSEFEKRNIQADFEYGIYDCTNDEMVYGSYVSFSNEESEIKTDLPKWENQSYYFGVNFPSRTGTLINRLGIWSFSSVVLILVIVFFGYTLFVIFRQKRLSEIQKDFINNMTHEFKTPISTIALSANVLKDPKIIDQPERLRNYATIIENENQRMKNQVERVLQIASVDTQIEFKKEGIYLLEMVQEIVTSMEVSIEKSKAIISITDDGSNPKLQADKLHLSNVIYNLLDNAIKYCEKKPEISIRVFTDRHKVVCEITDNGIGISEKELKRIFHRFYRVSTGNVHNVKGFGLGLSYVQQVVTAMGGMVKAKSIENKGSTFTLIFPINES